MKKTAFFSLFAATMMSTQSLAQANIVINTRSSPTITNQDITDYCDKKRSTIVSSEIRFTIVSSVEIMHDEFKGKCVFTVFMREGDKVRDEVEVPLDNVCKFKIPETRWASAGHYSGYLKSCEIYKKGGMMPDN